MREILVYDDYEIHKLGAGGGTQYEEVTTEKATRIDVTDVAKTKGKLIPFGRTEQKQLSGKNLLMRYAESGTIKDVAFSINDDGTIIANGLNDGTGNSQFFIDKYADGYTLPAGSYIINGCPSGGGIDSYRIGVQTIINGSYNTLAVDTGSGASFTLTETTTLIVFIIVQKNYNANNLLFKPMIRLASVTDDNYEQFCGGVPSPNPDFPQPIENVEGRSCSNLFNDDLLRQIEGYNSYDENTKMWTTSNLEPSYSRSFFYNAAGASSKRDITKLIKAKAGTYTFKFNDFINNTPSQTGPISIATFNDDGDLVSRRDGLDIMTITLEEDGYIDIRRNPNTGTLSFSSIQINEGSTVLPYEPYFEGKRLELNMCNKQLFNKNDYLFYRGYIVSSSNTTIHYESNNYMVYIPCKTNTNYTISKIITKRFAVGYTTEIPTDGVILQNVTMKNDSDTSISIQTGNDAQYLVAYIRNGNIAGESSLENIINSLQIEQGSTATSYEEHKEQMIPFPLAEGQKLMEGDYLAEDGVHHVRRQHILNGTENWLRQGSTHINILNLYTAVGSSWNVKKSSQNIYCTIAKNGSAGQNNDSIPNVINFNGIYNNLLLDLSLTDFTSVDDFISFLQTYNIIIEYDLAEETIDPYTPAQAEAYSKLMNLMLYKGVNHIWTETDGLEPNLQLTYKRVKQEGVFQVSNVQPLNNLELNNIEETPEEITTEISEE